MNENTKYEKNTQQLYRTLLKPFSKNIEVLHDVVINNNQIDVMWEHELAGVKHRTIVECKRHSSPISLNTLRAFITNMNELKANGIIITTTGFQAGVIEKAKEYGNVQLLKVTFKKKNGATLDIVHSKIENFTIQFDELTSTQEDLGLFFHLNLEEENLSIINSQREHILSLSEFYEQISNDVSEGHKEIEISDKYILLPQGSAIRIKNVEYDVINTSILPKSMRDFSPVEIKTIALIEDIITGDKKEVQVDNDWLYDD